MIEEVRHPDGRIEHPMVHHEPTDANHRRIFWILLGGVLLMALTMATVMRFFYVYQDYQSEIKKSPYPLAPEPSTVLPQGPRLEQVNRLAERGKPSAYSVNLPDERQLDAYGPTAERGFVHIPIDRAMQLVKDRLPSRPEPPAEQTRRQNGLVDGGGPNAGRLFREESR
jgi:hypothetical protein